MNDAYDLVVIGAGSGGLAAARRAHQLGKRVAIAEQEAIGGTCVNRGCIPTKLMIHAADFAKQQDLASSYGWVNPEGLFDWPAFKDALHAHVESLRQRQIQDLEGIDILRGQATFLEAHRLQVGDQIVYARYVLIAVGAHPRLPEIEGIEYALTSRDLFDLDQLPQSVLVAGGGYIGVEFSQILHRLGSQVLLVDTEPHVLDGFDLDLQTGVEQILAADGIQVLDQARLSRLEKTRTGLVATLADGRSFSVDQVLCALGRLSNLQNLALDRVAVSTDQGKIVVDPQGRTTVDHIFAVGDCTTQLRLTPVAKAEGEVAAEAMFGDRSVQVNYRWVPSAVFIHPEVATVGLSEEEARQEQQEIDIHYNSFSPLEYALSDESLEAFIKVVVHRPDQMILGVHLIAPRAADVIQALVPGLRKGLTISELQNTIGIHPSVGEELFAL
ncbi:dihydrolipoyl dehydrogenase family protein [Lyngbya confervoides]|uniref:FAD-dependent oxidoreductase n=1 Tax=Lyngbya confervoides BDU141951 TaxID=1574623 RepID=A0ABD4T6Z3_9CYAN|nr:FAD-dependent oxidoreductase [Lyngbya confervoides]MCM1984406.1 FAD-dependent oxidoreductase [Lyngbya confervoides BDU141951]